MPAQAHFVADLAFELGPQYGVDPVLMLAISYHESEWGSALTPPGPGGTGDFIPRKVTPALKAALDQDPTFQVEYYKKNSVSMVKPTNRGWGHGLYQIDFKSHIPFIATGKWADPREAMAYSMQNVVAYGRDQVKRAFPNMSAGDLLYATIATYNAGPTNVLKALKSGRPVRMLDQKAPKPVTFSPNYVVNILRTSAKLSAPGVV